MDFLIRHMLRNSVARYPEKEAVVHGARRLSYRQVADHCASIACGLRSAGMQRGDRVGIYLDPSVKQVLRIFSVSQAGGVYVPINKPIHGFQEMLQLPAGDRWSDWSISQDLAAILSL